MTVKEALALFVELAPERVKFDYPLSALTHFRVGGPADAVLEITALGELQDVLGQLHRANIPWIVLGSGSNVLVQDKGVRGAVIRLGGAFLQVQREGVRVRAGGAVLMPGLAHTTAQWGLTGLECLVGIPGTVGGGVYMNAGIPEGEMKDSLREVVCVTLEGREQVWRREELNFSYRHSALHSRQAVVSSALFELKEASPEACEETLRNYLRKRTFQPLGEPNMGSMFRNPPGRFAGQLIEEAGLKGATQGQVQVSPKHANFFLNTGGATAADTLTLMEVVRRKVQERTGVVLESEILVVGEA